MNRIAYYITAHGYGHGTRSCDILNALHRADAEAELIVKTDLPPAFLESRLSSRVQLVPGAFDTGLIQKDGIQADLSASLEAADRVAAVETELIRQEAEYLRRNKVSAVVADIPAIPLTAAKQAGIPAIATSNFGWDWIYEDFVSLDARWQVHVDRFRQAYREADLLLRQPFAEPMSVFKERVDLPLLARPGTACRDIISAAGLADPGKKWVLLSFTALELDGAALDRLGQLRDVELFSVEPLHWLDSTVRCLRRSVASFTDILASMDVVVSKPGFGIVSECIANRKPFIYTQRDHFREYDVLVEGIQQYCRNAFIPIDQLYAGELEQALEQVDAAPTPQAVMPSGGAEMAAEHILRMSGQDPV